METVADVCRHVAGIQDAKEMRARLVESPANLFAVTSEVLRVTGTYRLIVSPPDGCDWPPEVLGPHDRWKESLKALSNTWLGFLNEQADPEVANPEVPEGIDSAIGELFNEPYRRSLNELESADAWNALCTVFHLHALADTTMAGLGLPETGKAKPHELFRLTANLRLREAGTLSTFPVTRGRVLPKMRVPQSGITLRSLSHDACAIPSGVDVRWLMPTVSPRDFEKTRRLRLGLFPWPFKVVGEEFGPADSSKIAMGERFGFFEFEPRYEKEQLLARLREFLAVSIERFGELDGLVLPECAIAEGEVEDVWAVAKEYGAPILLTGVRGDRKNSALLRLASRDGKKTFNYEQDKHHRWFLESNQIHEYSLGHRLRPDKVWWESMHLSPRQLTVLALSGSMTLCHLICEDLARVEPVAEVVRAIGPTLLIALLMDGPQVPGRWSGRYTTVFADDPGCSVLTLTSLGMSYRHKAEGYPRQRAVALWRDAKNGTKTLSMDANDNGLVLTLWSESVEEFTADGRSDHGRAGQLTLGSCATIPRPA